MKELTRRLLEFRDARAWGQFHDPKNLACAIGIEAAELNELFLWKSVEECRKADPARVREELADVLAFTLLLCHELRIDPEEAVLDKIALNEKKYPIDLSYGRATKYTELGPKP